MKMLKKLKLTMLGTIITRRISSAFYKYLEVRKGFDHPFDLTLREIFDLEVIYYDDRLSYDISPYKVYVIDFLKIFPTYFKKLMKSDIIITPGYGAVFEFLLAYVVSKIRKNLLIVKDTHWYWQQTKISRFFWFIYFSLLRKVPLVIVPGRAAYIFWRSYGFENIRIVHYYWLEPWMPKCLNTSSSLLYLRSKYDFIILYLGRLIKKRGIDIAIKAFSNLLKESNINSVFVIAGDGPIKDELISLSKQLNISDRIIFLGPVPEKYKECLYDIADIFVYVPIIEKIPEEWPIPPLESMKKGVPTIISTAVGSLLDLIPGVLVVKWGSVEHLSNLMKELALNEEERDRVSKLALKIANSINEKEVLLELIKAVRECIAGK